MGNSPITKAAAFAMLGVLLLSVAALVPQVAIAQTSPVGGVEQRLKIIGADGTACYRSTFTNLATLTGNVCTDQASKQIASFVFESWVELYSNNYQVTSSTLSNTVKVFNRDGTYHTVVTTGGPVSPPTKVSPTSNVVWAVYSSYASAQAVETAIGSGIGSYTADIRVSSPAASITLKDIVSGQSTTHTVTSQTTSFSFSQSGTTSGGGGCVGTSCTDQPTGKLYSKITLALVGGGFASYTTNQLGPLSPADLAIVGNGTPFQSIKYELWMHLDNFAGYNVPNRATFGDPTYTGNFGANVNNSPVNPNYDDVIKTVGGNGDYVLLTMQVNEADAIPHLTLTGTEPDGTKEYSGHIGFFHRAGSITLTAQSGTYKISIPQENLDYSVLGVVTSSTGGCNFTGSNTDCNGGGSTGGNDFLSSLTSQVAAALGINQDQALLVVIGVPVGVIVMMVAATKVGQKGRIRA